MVKLEGIIPYLVSPVDRDGIVKREVFLRLCNDLIEKGCSGLCVLGSCGEFPYLSFEQKRELVGLAVQASSGRVPVVACASGFSVGEAVKEARAFVELGADAITIMLGVYFPLKPAQIASFYRSVAESVPDTTCILYTNPQFMHFDLSLDVLAELLDVKNIIYYKEASGQTGKILSIHNRFKGRFIPFSASAHIPLFVTMLGGVGWMAGPACLVPKQCIHLYELARRGDVERAMKYQERMWAINQSFSRFGLTACVKAGLEHLGYEVGDPVPPLLPLSAEARSSVARTIDQILSLETEE